MLYVQVCVLGLYYTSILYIISFPIQGTCLRPPGPCSHWGRAKEGMYQGLLFLNVFLESLFEVDHSKKNPQKTTTVIMVTIDHIMTMIIINII